MKIKLPAILIILLFVPPLLIGQTVITDVSMAEKRFEGYCLANKYEDIYIHTDREAYAAGENIFMKAYLIDRGSQKPDSGITYAYTELINPLNEPVARIRILLRNGTGSSVMNLPDTLLNGLYYIRSYTNFMKNYMPAGCFRKKILIINPFSNKFRNFPGSAQPPTADPYIIRFCPEGGKIISGIPCRIGLFAYDRYGYPSKFCGSLTDSSGNTIAGISIDSTGLGMVSFIPQKGMSYTARSDSGGILFRLPIVNDSGIAIRFDSLTDNHLSVSVYSPSPVPAAFLAVRARNRLSFIERLKLTGIRTNLAVPSDILAPGINEIVVFDSDGILQCIRYIWRGVSNTQKASSGLKHEIGCREAFDIGADETGDLIPEYAGISVSAHIPGLENPAIDDYLVFGSEYYTDDLQSDPASLFFKLPPDKREILLTGIRSCWIDWNKIIRGFAGLNEFNRESSGRYISVMRAKEDGSTGPFYNPAFMTITGKNARFRYSLPDRNMKYTFIIENGETDPDIVFRMPDSESSKAFIIREPYYDKIIPSEFTADTVKPDFIDNLYDKIGINYQVMKIYNKSDLITRITDTLKTNAAGRFYGKPDLELFLKDYISLPAMQEVFSELIPHVIIKTAGTKKIFRMIDPVTNSVSDADPSLFIDGIMIDDPQLILDLNPETVEKIDIVFNDYMIGDLVFNGILNIITKSGHPDEIPLPANLVRFKHRLYDPPADFIPPDFSDPSLKKSRIPDFRNTLLWKDNLQANGYRNKILRVWTSDFKSDYLITIQGIGKNGNPHSLCRIITVK